VVINRLTYVAVDVQRYEHLSGQMGSSVAGVLQLRTGAYHGG